MLIVIVVLGVLATVTVFAVRGITNQGEASATAADERTLAGAQEAYMAQHGDYGTEAELVADGLLNAESTTHDIDVAVDRQSYQIVAGGGGGGGVVASGTPTTLAGVPVTSYGVGPAFVVIGGPVTLAEWNTLVDGGANTWGKTMVFIDVADISTPAQAEGLHDLYRSSGVVSAADDVPNFSGGMSLIEFMEQSNGLPLQFWFKLHDGAGLDVAWAFDN
ncbi:MAG: hypothetical protein H6514_14890 [Acidimicrobiaceae bacterium]|nr:hypothetical protein [Acidimicrobiaceae bacterium]